MLFNKDIEDLWVNGFEGSHEEHRIFREVFLGNDSGRFSKRCHVTGVINFECDSSEHSYTSHCSHSDNSAVTGLYSSRYLGKDFELVASVDRSYQNAEAKRMKLSGNGFPNAKREKESSLNEQGALSCQTIPLHLVESSSLGITTSYLLKQQINKAKEVYLGGSTLEKARSQSLDYRKKLFGAKSIASPVSQESFATKSMVAGSSTSITEKSESALHLKDGSNGLNSQDSNLSTIYLKVDPKKDPRPLLHKHVTHLLQAAGWSIEKHKRPCRTYLDTIYISPEGRKFREFPKVWSTLGKVLMTDCLVMDTDTKKWNGINDFWSDLSTKLLDIDKNVNESDIADTLALRYSVLDPFVNVVFINRKIGSLRKGNEVKASQSSVIDKCMKSPLRISDDSGIQRREEKMLPQPCDSSLAPKSILTDSEGSHPANDEDFDHEGPLDLGGHSKNGAYKQNKMPEDSSGAVLMDYSEEKDELIEGQGSDSMDNYNGCKRNESTSPELQTSGLAQFREAEEFEKCSGDLVFDTADAHEGVILGNISQKKSEKISEIEPSVLDQSDALGLNSPCQDTDMDDIHLRSKKRKDKSLKCNEKNQSCGSSRKKGKKKASKCQIHDNDLLVSAIMRSRDYSNSRSQSNRKKKAVKSKVRTKKRNNKGGCKLLPRSTGKGKKQFTEAKWPMLGPRTVLSWLIATSVISLNEVVHFRNPKDDSVVKTGLVTRDGIVCICCNRTISLSVFKNHAGFNQNRPCLNLFTESGKPFNICQLQAWSAEYKTRKSGGQMLEADNHDPNDDSCGLCGDGGELICCDNCPSAYHQACLSMQMLPESSWYCSNCTCRICGELVSDREGSSSSHAFKCSQCEHKYHEVCLQGKSIHKATFPQSCFCGGNCEQVYTGLSSRIGAINHIADGLSWMLLRCIDEDQKVHSTQWLGLKAECNSKLAVALSIMEESFQSMVDSRTGIDMIPHVLYNWGSNFARLNFQGFYAVVVEKDDVLISVASIRVHGTMVAEMPLIATCSNYRRQGMCRRLMDAIEEMLISLKVETLVIAALPELVQTWAEGFGFKPVEEQEKQTLKRINLMVFPGTLLLKKTLYEPSNPNTPTDEKVDEEFNVDDRMEKTLYESETGNQIESEDAYDGPTPGFAAVSGMNQSTETGILSEQAPIIMCEQQSDGNSYPNDIGSIELP